MAIDVLIVINYLNSDGPGALPIPDPGFTPPPFLDISGDDFASPTDALRIINYIN